jgi:hypothetical protein
VAEPSDYSDNLKCNSERASSFNRYLNLTVPKKLLFTENIRRYTRYDILSTWSKKYYDLSATYLAQVQTRPYVVQAFGPCQAQDASFPMTVAAKKINSSLPTCRKPSKTVSLTSNVTGSF